MHEEPVICHEASGVVGIIKPAGLPTQAPPGIASVESWLRERLPAGGYLGVPHRLDRPVSGVMLFAMTPRAARQLSRQFERRQVRKVYLAMVACRPDTADCLQQVASAGSAGLAWSDMIDKVPDEPRARIAVAGAATAKPATTHVRLLSGPDAAPLALALEPLTGRMHQLRVQAASRGLPILGDSLYGSEATPFGQPTDDPRAAAIALHAWRITFTDPDTKQSLTLEAPVPVFWPPEVAAAAAATGA